MLKRAEVGLWKHSPKPLRRVGRVSVAIVLGAWESHVQGEGPQPVGVLERYNRM